MSSHTCNAIVIACIDFRFQKYIDNWIKKNLTGKKYDRVGWAGSTKDLTLVLKQIGISKRLHGIREVILIHHENCGAYGQKSTPETHKQELKKAKAKILANDPDLKVDLYYLHLDGRFDRL